MNVRRVFKGPLPPCVPFVILEQNLIGNIVHRRASRAMVLAIDME